MVELSYVVPAHNSADIIEDTIEVLAKRLADVPSEIIVVENGSTDGTGELLARMASGWSGSNPALIVTNSPKGLGNALRCGIIQSTGTTVVLTADDLPFGFDDLERAQDLGLGRQPVVIGSKAHSESEIERSALRSIMSFGYRALLRVILGMRTGDPQGTFVMDGTWARQVAPLLKETGYLVTTEIAWAAELMRIRPVEVPVRLRATRHNTRISPIADSLRMARGMLMLRGRRRTLRSSLQLSAASKSARP